MIRDFVYTMTYTAFALLVLATNSNAQVITAFSNDFEDGDLIAEVGSMDLVADTAIPFIVPVSGAPDAINGNNVVLIDLNQTTAMQLDLTLNLTNTLSLTDGNTVSLDFDVAARRVNGIQKTIHVDAVDSNGNIVMRFVLGDVGSFGNSNADRQRPGYATRADGRLIFGSPPGSYWYGSDTTPDEFNAPKDVHMSLTIGASSFDFSTANQVGVAFDATGVSNYEPVVSTDVAAIRLTTPFTGFGMYFDNLKVEGVVAVDTGVLKGDVDLGGDVNFLALRKNLWVGFSFIPNCS